MPTVPVTDLWSVKGGSLQEPEVELAQAYHRLGLTRDLADEVVVNVYEQHTAEWPHSITLCELRLDPLWRSDFVLTLSVIRP